MSICLHGAATLERHSAIKTCLAEQQNHLCELAKAVFIWWKNSNLVSDAISLTLHGFVLLAQTTLLALLLYGELHLLSHVLSYVLLHVLLHTVLHVGAQPP